MLFRGSILFLFYFSQAQAAGPLEQFYTSFIRGVSSGTCNAPESEQSCRKSAALQNQSQIQSVSSTIITNRLVELDNERNQCAKTQWDSLKGNSAEAKEMKTARVQQMNTQLSQLQDIRNQLETLGREMAQGPSLATLQQSRKYAKNKNEIDQQIADAKKIVQDKEDLAHSFLALYNQKLSEIPNSDSPAMAKFIESRISTVSTQHKPIMLQDYEKLIDSVSKGFQESQDDLLKSKSGNSYNLSVDEKDRLAGDPTLVAQLTREFPSAGNSIETYQCQASQHAKTKENIEFGANVASFAIPGGAFVLAKAARASYVLRSPKLASSIEKGSKYLGWASVGIGGTEATAEIAKSCLAENKTRSVGSCTLSPKLVIEEFQMSSCVWDATLAAVPGAIKGGTGLFAIKDGKGAGKLSEFAAEMRKKHGKNLDYRFAGKMKDGDRVKAAESIVGRPLTPSQQKAVIHAHNMDSTSYLPDTSKPLSDPSNIGRYSEKSQIAKRDYLVSKDFSEKEAKQLGLAGVTGNTPEVAETNIRKISMFLLKKDPSSQQVDAIWKAKHAHPNDKLKILTDAGFSPDDAQRIASSEFDNALEKAKGVVLSERAPAEIPPPPAKPVAIDRQKNLADRFEVQDGPKLQAAFDDSRKFHLAEISKDPDIYRNSPAKVIEASTTGLDTKKSADFIQAYVQDQKSGDEGLMKLVSEIDKKVAAEASKSSMQSGYNQAKLQELKVELLERHYTKKYPAPGGAEIDIDAFDNNDEKGFSAWQAAQDALEKYKKKGEKLRWPK